MNFQTFAALPSGAAIVLVNDYDHKPLYYQFSFELAGKFTRDDKEQVLEVWRVRIGKVGI
jgi:uncharacterized protein (DUF2249 family)